jgi:hypothetical protein
MPIILVLCRFEQCSASRCGARVETVSARGQARGGRNGRLPAAERHCALAGAGAVPATVGGDSKTNADGTEKPQHVNRQVAMDAQSSIDLFDGLCSRGQQSSIWSAPAWFALTAG